MDRMTQSIIDGIINDVRRSIELDKEEVGYINWGIHLEEVRSFREYQRFNMGASVVYHEAMKPYYWDYLTGKINYKVASSNLMGFFMDSFREFDCAAGWFAEKGIFAFADDCLRNGIVGHGFLYRLQELIELGYRRFIQDWPIDKINEYLERLEVVPDYRREWVLGTGSKTMLINSWVWYATFSGYRHCPPIPVPIPSDPYIKHLIPR